MDIPTIYKHKYAKKKRSDLSADSFLHRHFLLFLYNDLIAGGTIDRADATEIEAIAAVVCIDLKSTAQS